MSNEMNFTDRTTYLAAVAAWKVNYAELSQKIRDTRREFRDTQSSISKGQGGSWAQVDRLRYELESLRNEATRQLWIRADAKEEAQRQYEVQHQRQDCGAEVA